MVPEMSFPVLLLTSLVAGTFATECFVPLDTVYKVVPNFPTTDFCQRTCYSKYWMEEGNVRTISFTGDLKPGECPREFCQCMYRYMNQGTWLKGSHPICIQRCNSLTLELRGDPDPTYDPNAVDLTMDRPLEKLRAVLSQFTKNAQLTGLKCKTSCMEDECNCIHCMLECPLHGDQRPIEEMCQDIKDYFNRGQGLEDSETFCNKRCDTLEVEFVGNADKGSNCNPAHHRFFTYT